MSRNVDDEDYWNASEKKATNFFEEDEAGGGGVFGVSRQGTARLSQQLRDWEPGNNTELTSSLGGNKTADPIIPLHQLLSEPSLQMILEDVDIQHISASTSPHQLVSALIMGSSVNLEGCRKLEDKRELLNLAAKSGDGDAILSATLFVLGSLSTKYSNQLLRENNVAFTHYINYLSARNKNYELCNVLEALGNFKSSAILNYRLSCQMRSNIKKQIHNLNSIAKSHFNNDKDEKYINQHIKLLEFQQEHGLDMNLTAQQTVMNAASKLTTDTLRNFALVLGMNERLFQWTCLKAKISLQSWSEIQTIFQTKSWLGGQKFKPLIPMTKVAVELQKAGAPISEVNKYVRLVEDVQERQRLEALLASLSASCFQSEEITKRAHGEAICAENLFEMRLFLLYLRHEKTFQNLIPYSRDIFTTFASWWDQKFVGTFRTVEKYARLGCEWLNTSLKSSWWVPKLLAELLHVL